MAFGSETHDGFPSYEVVLEDPETGVKALVTVQPMYESFTPSDAPVNEEQRDALFQAVLTAMSNLGIMAVVSATKRGSYAVPVTP
jgi:hypothetical protein